MSVDFLSLVSLSVPAVVATAAIAEQAGTANAGICHAACYRKHFEMKPRNINRHAARGAPAPVVADL